MLSTQRCSVAWAAAIVKILRQRSSSSFGVLRGGRARRRTRIPPSSPSPSHTPQRRALATQRASRCAHPPPCWPFLHCHCCCRPSWRPRCTSASAFPPNCAARFPSPIMASVNVLDVQILNGELLPFSSTFRFQITFECVAEIPEDLVRACWLGGRGGQPRQTAAPAAFVLARCAPSLSLPTHPHTPPSPPTNPSSGLARSVRGQRQGQGL